MRLACRQKGPSGDAAASIDFRRLPRPIESQTPNNRYIRKEPHSLPRLPKILKDVRGLLLAPTKESSARTMDVRPTWLIHKPCTKAAITPVRLPAVVSAEEPWLVPSSSASSVSLSELSNRGTVTIAGRWEAAAFSFFAKIGCFSGVRESRSSGMQWLFKFVGMLVAIMALASCRVGESADDMKIPIKFSGGHETDRRDGGRPVVLVAAGLGVSPELFREAFRGVTPARADRLRGRRLSATSGHCSKCSAPMA